MLKLTAFGLNAPREKYLGGKRLGEIPPGTAVPKTPGPVDRLWQAPDGCRLPGGTRSNRRSIDAGLWRESEFLGKGTAQFVAKSRFNAILHIYEGNGIIRPINGKGERFLWDFARFHRTINPANLASGPAAHCDNLRMRLQRNFRRRPTT